MIVSNIALRIYGGAIDKGLDTQPVMAVGDIPNGFSPLLPTLVDEQQVWIITHAQAYTLYSTSSKRCHTVDDQLGQMLVCLFFPPQKRLADGNSPLALLDEIIDMFSVQGLRGGKLPNTPIDNAPFKTLLSKYRLEDRPVSLPIMQGHSPASLCVNNKNQLDALMRHSRYDILATIGCLELGFNCKSSISLKPSGKKPKKDEVSKVQSDPFISKEIFVNSASSNTGGLPLDDDPVEIQPKSWGKKLLKVAALIIGILFGLFVALVIVGMFIDDSDNQKATEIQVKEDSTSENQSASFELTKTVETSQESMDKRKIIDTEEERKKQVYESAVKKAEEETAAKKAKEEADKKAAEEAKKAEEAAKKKAEEAAKKKAEEAAKKKAEEAAKKKAEEAAKKKAEEAAKKKELENSAWQMEVKKHANKCPIQLRVGVRITSIECTGNSVTYTVNYEELSKYDMSSTDKDNLASDRSTIVNKYGYSVPARIKTVIIQKDKAGRIF